MLLMDGWCAGGCWFTLAQFIIVIIILFYFLCFAFPLDPRSFCMNVNETKDKELLKNDNFIASVGGFWSAPFLNGGWVAGVGGGWGILCGGNFKLESTLKN
jgi:hypothetical protein